MIIDKVYDVFKKKSTKYIVTWDLLHFILFDISVISLGSAGLISSDEFEGSGRNVVTFSFGVLSLFAKLVICLQNRNLKVSAISSDFVTVSSIVKV